MKILLTFALALAFVVQLGLGQQIKQIPQEWEIVPPPPTQRAVQLAAFGDRQFLHRVYARQIQEFGDTGGRTTRMVDYDMGQVVLWLDLLDQLDSQSQYQLALGLRYFASTPRQDQLITLVDYASRAVTLNPINRAQWLREAIVIADRRLKNQALALRVADQLAAVDWPDLNILAYQLAPLLRAKYGDFQGAAAGMQKALSKVGARTPEQEVTFMTNFVAEMQAKTAPLGNP
jgi:hypothetical protein